MKPTRVFILCLLLTACGKQRPLALGPHPPRSPLMTATKADLLQRISTFYDSIQSLGIIADLSLSQGSVYKGEIVDHSDFKGYFDFRKPGDLRIVTLLPVLRTTEFVMVSNAGAFRAYLSEQNRFIQGNDNVPATSANQMENIRPAAFVSALLVKPLDTAGDIITLTDDTTEQYSHYILQSLRKLGNGDYVIARTVTFDRVDLKIIEQREYSPDGAIVSLTGYSGWKTYPVTSFPSQIRIMRYLEAYGATLDITKLEVNKPEPDSVFTLQRPEGSILQILGGGQGDRK